MQALIDELSPVFRAIAQKLTSNTDLQADLVSEMYCHLCQEWQDNPNQTPGYYIHVCRCRAIDSLRGGKSIDSKTRDGVEIVSLSAYPLDGSLQPTQIASGIDFETEVIYEDLLAHLKEELTDKQARIVDFWLQGYTEREIGTMD